jgi:hypothetical protein
MEVFGENATIRDTIEENHVQSIEFHYSGN